MDSAFLSNVELYYDPSGFRPDSEIITLEGDEYSHIVRVMRHTIGEQIYVTDGQGHIFKCRITDISKSNVSVLKEDLITYKNRFKNVCFCVPKLKSADRFEFALEKSVELGITNFLVYDADKSVAKGGKTERWQKILISAMKQSLRSYTPSISSARSLQELAGKDGEKIIFEQETDSAFFDFSFNENTSYYFIFGPEGGFSGRELDWLNNSKKYCLTGNRLRAETAIISAASLLAVK